MFDRKAETERLERNLTLTITLRRWQWLLILASGALAHENSVWYSDFEAAVREQVKTSAKNQA